MAYQPKSYKKFVATAATATLVASAVAPAALAADFTDVTGNYKDAVDFVVSKGVNGTSATTFGTSEAIKRVDAAVMLASVLGLDIEKAPASGLTDVPERAVKHVNALKAAGITSGKTATTFDSNANITRGELAIWITNGFKLKSTSTSVAFADVTDRYKAAVTALVDNKVTSGVSDTAFGTNQNAKRGDFAIFLHRADKAATPVVATFDAKATGAKKVTATFSKEVDPTKVKFTVKKGSISVNVSKITPSEDKKSFVLETSVKLTEGDYTVSATGVEADALTKTFKAENEKIAKIEILSDVAPIKAVAANVVADQATVAYKVTNQYGEDVTTTSTGLSLSTTAADQAGTGYSAANKIITLDNNGVAYKSGDKVTVSLLDPTTGTFVSKVVTVSDKAQTAELAITSLYHADGKTLTADTAKADVPGFKLVLEAKDQYGNNIVPTDADVVVTTSNNTVLNINVADITTQTIDGKTVTVLPLTAPTGNMTAGTATITMISKTTGKIAKFDVVVANGVKADAISITAPEFVAAGETVKLPYSILDLAGKEITSETTLETAGKGVTFTTPAGISLDFVHNYLTGKAELQLTVAGNVATGKYTVIATTANGKTATFVLDVKASAVPTVIVGLHSSVTTNIVKGETLTIGEDKVLVQDQHGRTIGLDSLLANDNYRLVLSETPASDRVTVTTENATANDASVAVRGDLKGSATLQLKLQKFDATANDFVDVTNSQFSFTTNVVEKADIVSYELGQIGKVYDDVATGYKRDLTVYGVLANGSKVVVPASWYTVTTNNAKLTYSAGQLDANAIVGANNADVTVKVDVVVDASNAPAFLTQDVVVTKAAPVVESAELSSSIENGAVTFAATAVNATTFAANFQNLFTFTDQYGQTVDNDEATLTFTNLVNSNRNATAITVSGGNGTVGADIDNAEAGDSFNATIRIKGYTNTIKVIVTP
jgi:trimeric autotransporter adhesin